MFPRLDASGFATREHAVNAVVDDQIRVCDVEDFDTSNKGVESLKLALNPYSFLRTELVRKLGE